RTGGKARPRPPHTTSVPASSRHAITEAGLGTVIAGLGQTLDACERGDGRYGTLRYLGPVNRPEFTQTLEGVEQSLPPGCDPMLPQGGKRFVGFDANRLPVLILTNDHRGNEVEYYCYERVQSPERLGDDEFNPER